MTTRLDRATGAASRVDPLNAAAPIAALTVPRTKSRRVTANDFSSIAFSLLIKALHTIIKRWRFGVGIEIGIDDAAKIKEHC
jgi:hypothetical protein